MLRGTRLGVAISYFCRQLSVRFKHLELVGNSFALPSDKFGMSRTSGFDDDFEGSMTMDLCRDAHRIDRLFLYSQITLEGPDYRIFHEIETIKQA